MGLFSRLEDPKLAEAKKNVVATEQVCPACAAKFVTSASTLVGFNVELALETHRCASCGHEIFLRRG